jgi:hypothetical protein
VKVIIALTLPLVRDAIVLTLMTYARQHYTHTTPSSNATLSCIFYKPHDGLNYVSETLDYKWMIVLEALVVALVAVMRWYKKRKREDVATA